MGVPFLSYRTSICAISSAGVSGSSEERVLGVSGSTIVDINDDKQRTKQVKRHN